jgi:hypothetical protein
MAQLKLDLTTGRLAVEDGGFADVDGLEEIRQQVWLELQIFLGECKYDVEIGVPWIQEVAAVGTPPERLAAIFRKPILGTTGVTKITKGPTLTVGDDRSLSLAFEALTDAGLLKFTGPISTRPVQEVE